MTGIVSTPATQPDYTTADPAVFVDFSEGDFPEALRGELLRGVPGALRGVPRSLMAEGMAMRGVLGGEAWPPSSSVSSSESTSVSRPACLAASSCGSCGKLACSDLELSKSNSG